MPVLSSDRVDRSPVAIQDAVNGYFQSWYPVAMASEVASGQVISKPFLDGKIAVFRGKNGVASVVSAYCRHLGADLSGGEVVGDYLRCPYHHWSYDQAGHCAGIPFGKPSEKAKLFKFPTVEALGLIWAFNGEEPLFDFPGIDGFDPGKLAYRIADLGDFPVEAWVMTTNSFDVAHLKALHGMKVEVDPDALSETDHSISWRYELVDRHYGSVNVRLALHGSNIVVLANVRPNGEVSVTLSALTPVGVNKIRYYLLSAVPLEDGEGADDETIQQRVGELENFLTFIVEEDRSIMEGIRFKPDVLVEADSYISGYIDWLSRYPRAHPSRDYIA